MILKKLIPLRFALKLFLAFKDHGNFHYIQCYDLEVTCYCLCISEINVSEPIQRPRGATENFCNQGDLATGEMPSEDICNAQSHINNCTLYQVRQEQHSQRIFVSKEESSSIPLSRSFPVGHNCGFIAESWFCFTPQWTKH